MTRPFYRAVIRFEYNWAAYHVCGAISKVTALIHVAHPIDTLATIQRKATIRAHAHRVRAENAFTRPSNGETP